MMGKELTGRDVLAWLCGFFLVVIAVNVWFIYAAVTTFRGEDEQRPYLQGIAYSETLARRAAQAKLGWRATIGAERLPTGQVQVDVVLTRADGLPAASIPLTGELRHPADETRDRNVRLVTVRAGAYQGELQGISTGAWDMVVKAADARVPFEASRRIWVP